MPSRPDVLAPIARIARPATRSAPTPRSARGHQSGKADASGSGCTTSAEGVGSGSGVADGVGDGLGSGAGCTGNVTSANVGSVSPSVVSAVAYRDVTVPESLRVPSEAPGVTSTAKVRDSPGSRSTLAGVSHSASASPSTVIAGAVSSIGR